MENERKIKFLKVKIDVICKGRRENCIVCIIMARLMSIYEA